jgi:hypothetical protein
MGRKRNPNKKVSDNNVHQLKFEKVQCNEVYRSLNISTMGNLSVGLNTSHAKNRRYLEG